MDIAAAVWIVAVVFALLLPGVTETGEKVTVAPEGSPVAEKVTGLLKSPFIGVTVMVYCTLPPAFTV